MLLNFLLPHANMLANVGRFFAPMTFMLAGLSHWPGNLKAHALHLQAAMVPYVFGIQRREILSLHTVVIPGYLAKSTSIQLSTPSRGHQKGCDSFRRVMEPMFIYETLQLAQPYQHTT